MIYTQAKRFQLTLWETEHRVGVGVQVSFNDVVEAVAEFESQHKAGRYRAGLLVEYHEVTQEWLLIRQYP